MGTSSSNDDFDNTSAFSDKDFFSVFNQRDKAANQLEKMRIKNLRRRNGGILANVNTPSSTLG